MHSTDKSEGSTNRTFKFPSSYFQYLPSDEARRRFYFAKDETYPKQVKTPDSNLVAKAMMEGMLMNWFYYPNLKQFENSSKAMSWFRNVVEKFSTQEIHDIWEWQREVRKGHPELPNSIPIPELKDLLAQKLRDKKVEQAFINNGLEALSFNNPSTTAT